MIVFETISSDFLRFSDRNKPAALMLFLAALGRGVDVFLSLFLSFSRSRSLSQLQMRTIDAQCMVESGM